MRMTITDGIPTCFLKLGTYDRMHLPWFLDFCVASGRQPAAVPRIDNAC